MNIKLNYSKMELTQNKNINRILSYIFIFVMIFFSRDTLITSITLNFHTTFIIQIVTVLFVTVLTVYTNRKNLCLNKMSFLMGFSLCTLMAIPTMMKLDFQLYIVSILFYIGTAILFTCIFTIDHLLKSYSNIISCLALYSLIPCYALRFVWFPEGAVDQSLSIILNSSGTPFINCGLSYVVAIPTYIRNFGIFREPGVYQFFLLIALVYEVLMRKSFRIVQIFILSLTVITTFSAPGILGMLIIYFIFAINMVVEHKITKKIIVYFGGIIIILSSVSLLAYLLNDNLAILVRETLRKITSINESSGARLKSLFLDIHFFFDHPFLGVSFATVVADNGSCINSTFSFFAIFGLFAGALLLWIQYQLSKLCTDNKIMRILVFLLICLLVNTQFLLGNTMFWIFIFTGLIGLKEDQTIFYKGCIILQRRLKQKNENFMGL